MVQKALSKIKDIEINIVAPTHGPIYRSNPKHIIELYDKWSKHETDKGVVIAYASMYRNTQVLTENITRAIAENGIEKIIVHNVSKSNASYIINDIWQYKGLILGTCTYNTQMFPYMNYLVNLLENKQLEKRYIGIFGSYSWSGGGFKGLQKFVEGSKLELVEPSVEAKCHPTNEDLTKGEELGKNMADKVLNA